MTTMTVTNDKLDQFVVRLVPVGDLLHNGLTQRPDRQPSEWERARGKVIVEFYDAEYAGKKGFTKLGQFVSSYAASTLLERVIEFTGLGTAVGGYEFNRHRVRGLNLDGGIAKWQLDADAMEIVLRWVVHELETNHHMGTTWLPEEGAVQLS